MIHSAVCFVPLLFIVLFCCIINILIFRRNRSGQSLDQACQRTVWSVLRLPQLLRHHPGRVTQMELPAQGYHSPRCRWQLIYRPLSVRNFARWKCLHRKFDSLEKVAALRIKKRLAFIWQWSAEIWTCADFEQVVVVRNLEARQVKSR